MKALIRLFLIAILLFAISRIQAQNADGKPDKKDQQSTVRDKEIKKRLEEDIAMRFPLSKNSPITWDDTQKGYVAVYTYNKNEFMTRYDKNGSYQGTLI